MTEERLKEIKFEIKTPIFETNELQFIDDYTQEIARDFAKKVVKEKDQLIAQRIIKNQLDEIDKLKNIIHRAINYLSEFEYDMETGGIHMDIIMGILRGKL